MSLAEFLDEEELSRMNPLGFLKIGIRLKNWSKSTARIKKTPCLTS
ncbi:hypothetical protein IANJMKHF_00424 [Klebsiella phage CPRSA]|nr:hypothetical protein IANJMKHF_00424 [Klebsiella phage CPRSA]